MTFPRPIAALLVVLLGACAANEPTRREMSTNDAQERARVNAIIDQLAGYLRSIQEEKS